MKIIFLDIDGVLNHNSFYEDRHKKIQQQIWDLEYPHCELDSYCVDLLGEFCEEHDIKIVISSTWRHGKSVEDFNEMFSGYKGTLEVIGKTPSFHTKGWVRGNEIRWWMEENEELLGCRYHDYYDYCILDDDSDMLYWQKDNFLKVDRYVGITAQTLFEMKKIFRLKLYDDYGK